MFHADRPAFVLRQAILTQGRVGDNGHSIDMSDPHASEKLVSRSALPIPGAEKATAWQKAAPAIQQKRRDLRDDESRC